jgi:hypothetical protein
MNKDITIERVGIAIAMIFAILAFVQGNNNEPFSAGAPARSDTAVTGTRTIDTNIQQPTEAIKKHEVCIAVLQQKDSLNQLKTLTGSDLPSYVTIDKTALNNKITRLETAISDVNCN